MNKLYAFVKEHILSNFGVGVNLVRGRSGKLTEFTETEEDGRVICAYTPAAGLESLTITAKIGETGIVLSIRRPHKRRKRVCLRLRAGERRSHGSRRPHAGRNARQPSRRSLVDVPDVCEGFLRSLSAHSVAAYKVGRSALSSAPADRRTTSAASSARESSR